MSCTPGAPKPNAHTLTVGQWTNLGPPGVATAAYGVIGVTLDPTDMSVIYATVQDNGIWKTTDGGATWAQIGDPTFVYNFTDSTPYLDVPFEVAVDPCNPQHLYATDGVRGKTLGFWVSQDGGATWHRTAGFKTISATTTVDVTDLAVDPTDFGHILLSSHSAWQGMTNAGVLESMDSGNTWIAHPPVSTWPSGTPGIEFIFDPKSGTGSAQTWLLMTNGNGFWRTTNAGGNWTQVSTTDGIHGLTTLFRASTGVLYAGGTGYPQRSTNQGTSWQLITNGLPSSYYYAVHGDGTTLYTMRSLNYGAQPYPSYSTSPESDGTTWMPQAGNQTFSDGPIVMKYDAVDHIMYSANWKAGLLALKTQ